MLQKIYPWLAGGMTVGLAVSLCFWLYSLPYLNAYLNSNKPVPDQAMVANIIQAGIDNPEVQAAIKNQISLYLKSPEGKKKIAETLKSPEVTKALSEHLQSPEIQTAMLKLMQEPEFRRAVKETIKDTPEMQILSVLATAITANDNKSEQIPAAP